VTAGGSATLTATCSPAATSYAWTNTGFAATVSAGTVSPMVNTTYSVIGSNAAGSGNPAGATVTVTCTYSLFPTSQSVATNATTGTLSVTAASGCAWTATSNVAWITITSGSSGSGNGTVVYAVAANPSSSSRVGTLTIAGQTLTVIQAGITVPILGLQYYPLPRPIRLLDTRPGETAACNKPGTPVTGGTPLPLPPPRGVPGGDNPPPPPPAVRQP